MPVPDHLAAHAINYNQNEDTPPLASPPNYIQEESCPSRTAPYDLDASSDSLPNLPEARSHCHINQQASPSSFRPADQAHISQFTAQCCIDHITPPPVLAAPFTISDGYRQKPIQFDPTAHEVP